MASAIHHHELAIGMPMSLRSWTPLPHASPHYPSRLPQSTDFVASRVIHKTPTDCFTYAKVYVLMIFSQIIPTSPSPAVSQSLKKTRLLITSVCTGSAGEVKVRVLSASDFSLRNWWKSSVKVLLISVCVCVCVAPVTIFLVGLHWNRMFWNKTLLIAGNFWSWLLYLPFLAIDFVSIFLSS